MRLPAALLLLALSVTSCGGSEGEREAGPAGGDVTRTNRLFLPSITASIASWVGLNQQPPPAGVQKPPGTTIVYVKKPSKPPQPPHPAACKSILSDAECPPGKVCSLSHTCVPKSADGESCLRDAQCVSGSCHGYRCVSTDDHCHEGDGSCPPGEQCVLTSAGRRCKPKDTGADACASPLTPFGCPSGKYCDHSGHCTAQLATGEQCQLSLQCAGGVCRAHVCRSDECPTLYSSRYCQDGQFCAPSELGNECRAQLDTGHECVADAQCLSRRCERSRCVRHQCEEHAVSASSGGCAAGEFCMPAQDGNLCVEKRPRGEWCSADVECVSGRCVEGRCYQDECPTPGRDDGCRDDCYCVSGISGNSCVDKKPVNERCSGPDECLSDICAHGKCIEHECAVPGDDAGCPPQQYCIAALVGNICVGKKTTGEQCASGAECLSNTCRDHQCVQDGCTAPGSRFGCPMHQYCVSGAGGNMCVSQKDREEACYSSVECLSDLCVDNKCYQDLCSPLGSDDDCPQAQYCAASHLGNECVYKKQVGMGCVSGDECMSGDCRNWKCVMDECSPVGQQGGCGTEEYCTTGLYGNVCAMLKLPGSECEYNFECSSENCRDKQCVEDECYPAGEQGGCSGIEYCTTGNTGNVCAYKKNPGQECEYNIECLSRDCRQGQCVLDRCPAVGSEDGCGEDQYCSSGGNGNVCIPKKPRGYMCSDAFECLSGDCRTEKCYDDQCPTVSSEDGCDSGDFCSTGENGNECVPKKPRGEACSGHSECTSGQCVTGKCFESNCNPGDCEDDEFCAVDPVLGNECVPKLPRGDDCTDHFECISDDCMDGKCIVHDCNQPGSDEGCPGNLVCASSDIGNTCVPKKMLEDTCDTNDECAMGKCLAEDVDAESRCLKCTKASASTDCQADQFCNTTPTGHQCKNKKTTNAECDGDDECTSGNCDDSLDPPKCQA